MYWVDDSTRVNKLTNQTACAILSNMASTHDTFPEEFSVGQLADPELKTIAAFQAVCAELDGISDVLGSWRDNQADESSGQHATYFLKKAFENGSVIDGTSTHGTDDWLEMYAETMPIRSINLWTREGIKYDYTEDAPGRARLWIRKPGERVVREEAPVDSIDIDSGNGTSLQINGTPDFMQAMAASLAERREVRKQGLDRLTDGGLREFTAAIRDALSSGVTSTETPQETDPIPS